MSLPRVKLQSQSSSFTKRGIKPCAKCGTLNGLRSKLCKNTACELHQQPAKREFEPIQLVSYCNSIYYSIRAKNIYPGNRNIVQYNGGSYKCFVETCGSKTTHTLGCCKHIKSLKSAQPADIGIAEVYAITKEVLFNLNLEQEHKQRLWQNYALENDLLPSVQRLLPTVFAIKCAKEKNFPAARLHIHLLSNALLAAGSTAAERRKQLYSCACKKLKIILEPDNSVVMQEDMCDHLLLLLSAILSHPQGKREYSSFVAAHKHYWMPNSLETPLLLDAHNPDDSLFDLSCHLSAAANGNEQSVDIAASAEDILIFGNDFLAGSDSIPDFCDIVPAVEQQQQQQQCTATADFVFGEQGEEDSTDYRLQDINSIIKTDANEQLLQQQQQLSHITESTHLELSECAIELMDEYQLTDRIDLCGDDILLPLDESQLVPSLQPLLPLTEQQPQTIELPTIEVKKCDMLAANVVEEVKTRKYPRLPPKRALIVNTNGAGNGSSAADNMLMSPSAEPSLAFSAWLDFCIERINACITPQTAFKTPPLVRLNFHVHEEIFAHFSKRFSLGVKRRNPSAINLIKQGPHEGLTKYTYQFDNAATVQRIFCTTQMRIELIRSFQKREGSANEFVFYQPQLQPKPSAASRPVYAKMSLYFAKVLFEGNSLQQANHFDLHKGLRIEWIPAVFAKSNFGILNIEFAVAFQNPHNANENVLK